MNRGGCFLFRDFRRSAMLKRSSSVSLVLADGSNSGVCWFDCEGDGVDDFSGDFTRDDGGSALVDGTVEKYAAADD
jgi:hypothetical protein